MSRSEEKQGKEGWRGQKENNKNHWLKLVLVVTKQTRLSQSLLPYEVFAFLQLQFGKNVPASLFIRFLSKANNAHIHLRANFNGNLQWESNGLVLFFSSQWIQKAQKRTPFNYRLELFGQLKESFWRLQRVKFWPIKWTPGPVLVVMGGQGAKRKGLMGANANLFS